MQLSGPATLFELFPAATGARIVPAEFLDQLLLAMDYSLTTLDLCFGRETLSSFTGYLESTPVLHIWFSWYTSILMPSFDLI